MDAIWGQAQEQNRRLGGSVDPRTGKLVVSEENPATAPALPSRQGEEDEDEVDFAALVASDPGVAALLEDLKEDGMDVENILGLPPSAAANGEEDEEKMPLDLEAIAALEALQLGQGEGGESAVATPG